MKQASFIKNNKELPLILLGHLSFIVLLFASLIFYKERILFSDTAFQFFKIVNFEKINIEAHRYGALLPQLPVLIAIKLGFGLKSLTAIFSASFILLYYLIFICCTHLLKNAIAGIAIVLTLTLCIAQSFFHPVTETHQCLVFSILLYAILQYPSFRHVAIQYLSAIAIIVLSFFAHPVAVYPLAFIIGFVAIDKKQLRSIVPYTLLFVIIVLTVGKVILTKENSYEGKFFSELFQSPALLLELPTSNSTNFFIGRIKGLYFWLYILQIILFTNFILNKKYIKLGWQLAATGFFMLVTLITYHRGDSEMLMERAFMPLALFVSVPLLKELFTDKRRFYYLKLMLLVIVIGVGINRIHKQGRHFQERTRFNQEVLRQTSQYDNRKFIVKSKELQKHHYIFWSHSFEMLILSTITKEVPTQTIFPSNNLNKIQKYTTDKRDVFLGTEFWLEWRIKDLNKKYFNLPSDLPYKVVPLDDL